MRGTVLEGTRFVAFIIGAAPLPIAPLRKPAVFVRSLAADSLLVQGPQFLFGVKDRGEQ